MNFSSQPGKLLISMVGRHRGEMFVAAAKAAGARGGTIMHGRAVVDNKILQMLSLADTQQDIVFTLMRDEAPAVLTAVCAACSLKPKKLSGIALLLDVSGMLVRQSKKSQENTASDTGTRSKPMESGYVLLTAIVNHGYGDDVMAQARKAGARGGTILTARGTGTEEDVKFFGITLVPEKEVLMIVAARENVDAILDAVRTVPTLAEPGGGIVYSMNVEDFVLLGQ